MANTPITSVSPSKRKELKRSISAAGIDSDDDDEIKTKYVKTLTDAGNRDSFDKDQHTPLKITDSNIATSPLTDSGYDISVGNTPGSSKPLKFVQPGSSGYISDSDCGTPAVGQRTPGPFSPDFISKGKKGIAPFNPLHLRTFIRRNFVLLKDEVDPPGVADSLNTEGVISNRDVEMIMEEKYRVEKCDILLKAIARSTLKDDIQTPRKVISAFEKEGYGHLFRDFKHEKVTTIRPKEPLPTKDEIKRRLYINSSYLEDEIDPILIIDDLVAEEVLTLDEHQDIKQTDFKPRKVRSLIEYLLRKPEKDFLAFCNVLENHYQPLADILKKGTSGPMALDQCKKEVIDVTITKKATETFVKRDLGGTDSGETTEVKLFFCGDGKDEERMIVDDYSADINFDFEEEAMDIAFELSDVQFSSIRINLTSMSRQAQMELLKKCKKSPIFLKNWIQKLIAEKHIQSLKEKKIDKMAFQIKLCFPDFEQRTCSCKLTKEIIVQYYSLMEKEMKYVEQIIRTFGRFEGFDESTKVMFKDLLGTTGNKTENFLRKLLELSDTRLHLCLLEREMRITNPQLLQNIIKVTSENSEMKLSVADIRHNMNFLVDELEPRHFRDMLTGLEGSEHIVGKIMSTDPRKERCRELLNFIMQKKNNAIEMFVQELQRNNKGHVVDFLVASKTDEEQTNLKEALVENYRHIVDEIEPRAIRQIFVERREIKAKEFDVICKLKLRRQRAIMFMKSVLKQKGSALKCLIDSLEIAGYRHLVKRIRSDIDSYKDCPRLHQSMFVGQNTIHIDGELQLGFKQGDVKESALQLFLHRMIYVDNSQKPENGQHELEEAENKTDSVSKENLAKRLRTLEWIQMQQNGRKRERNDYDDTYQPSASKQSCREVALAVREVSPASSPLFGMTRQDDMGDNCSSARFTRSTSRGSEERPVYEDISPPSSPNKESMEKPHIFIAAPCSPLNIYSSKRRNSLSDGTSRTSSLPTSLREYSATSPCNSMEYSATSPCSLMEYSSTSPCSSRENSATSPCSSREHLTTVHRSLLVRAAHACPSLRTYFQSVEAFLFAQLKRK